MFKFLEGGMVEITASYPAGVIGNTLENLRAAAAGEHEEWSLDYPHFADVAEQEGFPMIAAMYRNISIAEKGHEESLPGMSASTGLFRGEEGKLLIYG